MKYLLDVNVWLDAILGRAHARDVEEFLNRATRGSLATTDFAVHTVGLYLYRDQPEMFRRFIDDLVRLHINTLHLAPSHLLGVMNVIHQHGLDFDDAFQYFAAERDDLTIISSDSDFDRTPRGRLTPAQALAEITAQEQR